MINKFVKVKYLFTLNMGQSPDSESCNTLGNGIPFLQGKADFGHISPTPKTYCISPKKIADTGDILLSVRAPVGDMNIADTECAIGRGLCALKADKLNPKYAWYMLHSVIDELKSYATGSTYDAVSTDDIKNIRCVVPASDIQCRVVKHLDKKIIAIDELISSKNELVRLLKEKQISLISQSVTRGLHPEALMRNCGIEWLGKIPAHWQVLTNHQLFAERNIKCTDPDAVLLSVTKHLGVILQSQAEELNLATVAPAETTEGYKVVHKGDLVMNIMRAKDGSYGISGYDGVISPAYCIYYPRQEVNPQYLYYLFKTPMYMEIFKNYSTGIAEHRMRLYPVNFFKIPAVVPPLEEQNEIVMYLDKRVKDIDELISLTQQQIEKLKEYRQSIISEVVTGKVAVG